MLASPHIDLGSWRAGFYTGDPFSGRPFSWHFCSCAMVDANSRCPSLAAVRLMIVCCAVSLMFIGSGCVRRRLSVRTNPPGAQVFVDDQEIGTTPCSAPFIYYGTRKITLMKDGYRTETIFQKIPPPWYEIPPLDFLVENIYPLEHRDE